MPNSVKCLVQWIDCRGNPTPDTNDAVGYAVLKRDNRRFPICAEHAKAIDSARVHFETGCPHVSRDPMSAVWTFEALS